MCKKELIKSNKYFEVFCKFVFLKISLGGEGVETLYEYTSSHKYAVGYMSHICICVYVTF